MKWTLCMIGIYQQKKSKKIIMREQYKTVLTQQLNKQIYNRIKCNHNKKLKIYNKNNYKTKLIKMIK